MFDDSLLDDPLALTVRGERVHKLALTGARLRCERSEEMAVILSGLGGVSPRSILVIGTEARLVRTIVESGSPVPCVAWQMGTLPAWTGPLDLVIILAGPDSRWLPPCREALKRGSMVFLVAPVGSPILEEAPSLPCLLTQEDDPFLAALLALKVIDLMGLGPELDLAVVADALDTVADQCGPRHGLETNPAKNLACALADAVPLVWGGTVLAARVSRRIAEALREATGLPALAADDDALVPLLEASSPRDVFADPFEDLSARIGFCLLMLDDGEQNLHGIDLARMAQGHSVRVETIRYTHGNPVVRYAGLLHQGLFAAAYLGLATMQE